MTGFDREVGALQNWTFCCLEKCLWPFEIDTGRWCSLARLQKSVAHSSCAPQSRLSLGRLLLAMQIPLTLASTKSMSTANF